MLSKLRIVTVLAVLGLALTPTRAFARPDQGGLGQLMFDTFTNNVVLAATPNGNGIVAHTAFGQFTPAFQAAIDQVTTVVQQVSQQVSAPLSNAPLGSSSGGFTFTFDPA